MGRLISALERPARSNKGRKFPAEILTPSEITALVRACSMRYPTGRRNAALIMVLYRAGLRISEALQLLPKDLDLERGHATVLHGKNNRRRMIALDARALLQLEPWLEVRPRAPGAPVFCTLQGTQMDPSYVRHLLPRLAVRAGIEKRVHPHGLRHTFAAELADYAASVGRSIVLVQRGLGHTGLGTTQGYIDKLRPREVLDLMRNRP